MQNHMLVANAPSAHTKVPPASRGHTIVASDEWAPFEAVPGIAPGSVFDRSLLADAPAGKHGQAQVSAEGHIVFARQPEQRVRFWGVNLSFGAQFLEHSKADELADQLLRAGYNLVRIHHHDGALLKKGGRSDEIDPQQLDRLEYLVAALKRRGIYIVLGLYSNRPVEASEIPELGRRATRDFQYLIPISDNAFETWARFAKRLLTHRNQHTGMTWAEDPALLSVYMLNEESMFFGGWGARAPDVRALYERAYKAWLSKQAGSSRRESGDASFNRFLVEVKRASDLRMIAYLRSIGVKALLTGDSVVNNAAQVLIREQFDVVDIHGYWNHPTFIEQPWSLPIKFTQRSAIADGLGLPRWIMTARIFGKPFLVSEFNYTWPNAARGESGLLMAGYAGLQAWDGVIRYEYASSPTSPFETSIMGPKGGIFSLVNDPINLLADRAGAFLFLHGRIAPAPTAVAYLVNDANAVNGRKAAPERMPDALSWLGLSVRVGALPSGAKDLASRAAGAGVRAFVAEDHPPAFAGHPVYAPGPLLERRLSNSGLLPKRDDLATYRSETGQLQVYRTQGTASLVTVNSESFVLSANAKIAGQSIDVANGSTQATIYVMAVDDKPLAASRRIMILHLTDSLNTGTTFANASRERLEDFGRLPQLVRRGTTTITLRLPDEDWQAWAVDTSGRRLHRADLAREGSAWQLKPDTVSESGTVLAYELVRP